MTVTITRKSLAVALLYVEKSAASLNVIKTANGWTITATY